MNKTSKNKATNKLKNRQGSALAFIIIALMVISVMTTSLLHIFNSNLKQAKHQQDSIEAYYLAYSGAELAYKALLTEVSKIDDLIDGDELTQTDIVYGNGKIDILAKVSDEHNFDGWIEISSTGTLNKNNQSYTRTLLFDPGNPVDRVWKNN